MITTITVAGQPVSLVALPTPIFGGPSLGAMRAVEFSFTDSVSVNVSPFTGQTQTQKWLGADSLSGTMTLPKLCQAELDAWVACLMQLRGMANAMLLGDPLKQFPAGNPLGAPAIPATVTDAAGSEVLHTTGWTPGKMGHLMAGDYLQVGYRLHRVLDRVDSDGSGNAAISIFPTLREAPAASATVITNNCVGIFRRSDNKVTWSADITRLSQMSFAIQEYR